MRLVDHCAEDIFTGDPHFYAHQYRAHLRSIDQGAVQAATMNRMLNHNRDHNIELVGSERPRHSLVLKADFPALEVRKQKAAMEWLKAYHNEYTHEKTM